MMMNNGVFQMLRQRFTTTEAVQFFKHTVFT